VTWTAVASGGNFTDDAGQQWLAEADVLVAPVDWNTGLPDAAIPVAVLPVGLEFLAGGDRGIGGDHFAPVTDVNSLDWAPSGDRVVIENISTDWTTGIDTHSLFVVSFDPWGVTNIVPLGSGRTPEWSPSTTTDRIAFWYNADSFREPDGRENVWLINPDGTGEVQLTDGGLDNRPHWSPDGAHLAFTRVTQSNKKGLSVFYENVMRVPAAGGTPVNLTGDLGGTRTGASATAVAWR
jgi:hypothetical protein